MIKKKLSSLQEGAVRGSEMKVAPPLWCIVTVFALQG
jgi:hypothetical protein